MPYALQRLLHGSPVLCPARALLTHIPLGPRPWLHQLRSRLPGFVRRLHSYYGGGIPLSTAHHRLAVPALPPLTTVPLPRLLPRPRSPPFPPNIPPPCPRTTH